VDHRFWAPVRARREAYEVTEVTPETHNVWTLTLEPPEGQRRPEYQPGQFQFLTLYRSLDLPVEEHPFTASSDPSEPASLAFSIKESGDFTSTVGQTKPGDKAALRGPYGRFSYMLQPDADKLVFIAGGIGITPLMSMLRHMRSTGADKRVLLIYGNRTQKDIAFHDELAAMQAGEHPELTVVHVLSEPDETWQGETGLLDRERLGRLCGPDLAGKSFYVCGPPPMSASVLRALRDLGVPASRMHHEHFAL
jgi:ferredoxin-NADP reductase